MSNEYARRAQLSNARALPGLLMHFLTTGADTNGAMAVIEAKAVPGMEPPPHTHALEDESFYMLDGEMEFLRGTERFVARPGDYVFLPRGIRHGMTLRSAIHVVITIAPAPFAQFFVDYSVPATSLEIPPLPAEPPSPAVLQDIVRAQQAYGITF
jgi:quercetin dioxygenase-like cupin family protein